MAVRAGRRALRRGHRHGLTLRLDILNFGNLLNKNWGWQYTAGFPGFASVIRYDGLVTATNKMKYDISTITANTFQGTFYRDDLRSRLREAFA